MELYHLRYLHAVVDGGGVRPAAEELHVSQSAVSRAVSSIEDEIGVALFVRQGRVNELNRFGRVFVEATRGVVRGVDDAVDAVRTMAGIDAGTVSVGFLHSLGTSVVPEIIRAHRVENPDVRVTLHQRSGRDVITDLAHGVTDLCVSVPGLFADIVDVTWSHLFDERLVAVVDTGHELARRSGLRLEELHGETFVAMDSEHTLRHLFDAACAERGFTPAITFEGTDIATLRGLIAGGLGVAVLPPAAARRDDVVEIPLTESDLIRPLAVGVVTGRYLPPAAKALRATATRLFRRDDVARR